MSSILIPDGEIIGQLSLPKAGGAPALKDFEALYVRDITSEDLETILDVQSEKVTQTPNLQEIRAPHHSIARLLAKGASNVEVALLTGYTPEYVYRIQLDPAFRELLDYYTAQKDQVFADVLERMKILGLNSLEELQKRMEENPEEWSKRELMELAELTLGKNGGANASSGGSSGPSVAVSVSFVSPASKFPSSERPILEGEIISPDQANEV